MVKPQYIEDKQLKHMLKVASVTGDSPVRDVALLYVAYGTGMMLTELASITISDYLTETGEVRSESRIRAEIAHNNKERPLYWTSPRVLAALEAYLDYRIAKGRPRVSHAAAMDARTCRGTTES